MAHMATVLTIIDIDGSIHKVCRSGLLFAYGDKSTGLPLTLLHDAAKIPDFGRDLTRPADIMARARSIGYVTELRYDAAHGRRYMLGAFADQTQRRIVLAAMDGIENLRQYHIDCGIPENELDKMAQK